MEVDVLALTDHDTLSGLAMAQAQAALEGLDLISGIEFSCLWYGRNIHVVALNFDPQYKGLVELVDLQTRRREQRSELIADKLAALGIDNSLAGAQKIANGASIGRPHFATFLVDSGHCRSIDQAFKRYLGAGKAGDIKQMWPDFDEVITQVSAAGGLCVLAHPDKYKMTRAKLAAMVDEFKACGGVAIEVVSGAQDKALTRDLAAMANKFELLASCGSDFHYPSNRWQELGKFAQLPDNVTPIWTAWE